MKLTDKGVSALLDKSAEMRYKYSIKRIADTESLWTIISDDGYYRLIDNNGKQLFPIWPFKEYVEMYMIGEATDFNAISIDLIKFENEVIDIIRNNNIPLAIFPISDDNTGKIIEANTFIKDLYVELANYK